MKLSQQSQNSSENYLDMEFKTLLLEENKEAHLLLRQLGVSVENDGSKEREHSITKKKKEKEFGKSYSTDELLDFAKANNLFIGRLKDNKLPISIDAANALLDFERDFKLSGLFSSSSRYDNFHNHVFVLSNYNNIYHDWDNFIIDVSFIDKRKPHVLLMHLGDGFYKVIYEHGEFGAMNTLAGFCNRNGFNLFLTGILNLLPLVFASLYISVVLGLIIFVLGVVVCIVSSTTKRNKEFPLTVQHPYKDNKSSKLFKTPWN